MKPRLSMLVAGIVLLFAPLTRAQVTSPCNAEIVDQGGFVHSPAVIANAARTLINQGADVHVIIVDSLTRYGTDLAAVESYFERGCPSWTVNGQRKANLFVVMVAPNDRAKNMFLGSYYAGAFDIPSTYSQLSNTYFKNRQWELGLAAVLQGTTSQALNFRNQRTQAQQTAPQQRTYGPGAAGGPIQTRAQTADSGTSGVLIFFLVAFIVVGIGVLLYFLLRKTEETTYTTPSTPSTGYTGDSTSYTTERSYAAAAPSHTTIINNNPSSGDGLLTGIVVGEMLSRPTRETVYVEQPAPTYVEPTPTYTEPAAPAQAPDTTWEDTSTQQQDTSFSQPEPETPSYDPPSADFGGGDSGFGGSSGGDSGF